MTAFDPLQTLTASVTVIVMWSSNLAAKFAEAQPAWSRWLMRCAGLPAGAVFAISVVTADDDGVPWWGVAAFAVSFVVGVVQWLFYLNRLQK